MKIITVPHPSGKSAWCCSFPETTSENQTTPHDQFIFDLGNQIEQQAAQIAHLQMALADTEALEAETSVRCLNQAAQIEMMRDLIPKRIPDGFVSFGKYCCEQESLFNPSYNVMTPHKKRYLSDCEEALATPDQALEQFAAKVREQCAKVCDTADKSTHPADLANAIRAIKELP